MLPGPANHMGPARAPRAGPPGSTLAAAAPTTGAACSDARAGSTSPALRAATPRQWGNPPRRGACSPWESTCQLLIERFLEFRPSPLKRRPRLVLGAAPVYRELFVKVTSLKEGRDINGLPPRAALIAVIAQCSAERRID